MAIAEGSKVPSFKAQLQDGRKVSSEGMLGTKYILYFYPADDTPTCTTQACNLRDHYDVLRSAGFEIFGVSPDGAKSHEKFRTKYDLPFDLIVDEDKSLCHAFGVWGEKQNFGRVYQGVHRVTFVIDETGTVTRVIEKVKAKVHHEQILENQ